MTNLTHKKETSLQELKKYKGKVIIAPILKLFEVAVELMLPFLVRYILDEGVAQNNESIILKIGAIMLALAFAGFAVTMVAQYLAAKVSSDFGHDLRAKLFKKLSLLSEEQLNEIGKSKIDNLISNDSLQIQNGVMMFMRLLLRPPFLLLGSCIMSFIIDWRSGLIFIAAVVCSSFVLLFVMFKSPKLYVNIQNEMDEISTISSDDLKGSKSVKAFGKEEHEINRFSSSTDEYKKRYLSVIKLNSLINPLTFLFINLAMVLVVYLGNISMGDSDFTIGKLVSLISYLVSSLAALIMFSRMIVSLNRARASRARIDEFLSYEPLINNNPKETETKNDSFIKFENVSFSYSKTSAKKTIDDMSFEIGRGQTLGIIGGTGSGKTTIVSLLTRIYDADNGRITINGKDIKDYDIAELRKMISVSPQKPAIFKNSIKYNISFSDDLIDESNMNRSLNDSLAREIIDKFDDGLGHMIEEYGANLSGGQRQRILIARALYHGGDVLVLDDSLSALDYLSDLKIRENISRYESMTKIIISQRATSLRNCDLILVLDHGRIENIGNHEELLETSKIYKDIYEMQAAMK